MSYYDIGDSLKLRTSTPFQVAITGVLIDPDIVTFTIKTPSNIKTEYVYGIDSEVIREAEGDYSLIIRPDIAGIWRYSISGTTSSGTALSATEGRFEVRQMQARR